MDGKRDVTMNDMINVLDKIKAEIEQRYRNTSDSYAKGRNMDLSIATRIIDRYKTEIEYVEEDEELIIDKAQFEKFNKSIGKR